MKLILTGLTVLAIALAVFGYDSLPPVSPENPASALIQMERSLGAALDSGDVTTVDRILANDATVIGVRGGIETKQQLLYSEMHNSTKSAAQITYENLATRDYGSTAVLTGVPVWTLPTGQSDRWWFTDTFVNREGQWRIVAAQKTRESKLK
jgi:hypothetical protein